METIHISKDIPVCYITASSFPDGVLAAHQQLHTMFPYSDGRRYFGISRPEHGGGIVYRAAAEELQPGEGQQHGCDTLTLKAGNYLSVTIPDFMKDIPAIGRTFATILAQPGLNPNGYCVEQYINQKDVQCMVRLAD